MAVFAFIFGSLVGACAGLAGWSMFGMDIASAMTLYLSTSLLVGTALVLSSLYTPPPSRGLLSGSCPV